jgi:hypothetical protein
LKEREDIYTAVLKAAIEQNRKLILSGCLSHVPEQRDTNFSKNVSMRILSKASREKR